MKKFTLFATLLLNLSIYAQEISKDFIESLPKDIQKDVLNRSDDKSLQEDPTYRSIESQSKLDKKNIEDLITKIEADLKYIEEKLNKEENYKKDSSELKIFGSDFFNTYQSTYMPINEPNLGSDYFLDFGDILEIQLIGQKDSIKRYNIKRDGSINLPDIGKISLAGLALDEAINVIRFKVEEAYIGTQAFVTLTNLRDVNVLVTGNAFNPGIYTVAGNSNILHVLSIAGGINELGSYREINLIRNKEVIETLDIYDILINGYFNSKVTVRSGDIIHVSSIKNIVSVDGAVKKPAKYELNNNQNLSDVIKYADGLSIEADLNNIFLERLIDGKFKALPIVSIRQFEDFKIEDGDKIFIGKLAFRSINVQGAVLRPGEYIVTEEDSLQDVIKKAGGYSKNAYPFGAIYENKEALKVNIIAKDILYKSFIDNIILASQKNPNPTDLASLLEITEKLRSYEPNGRVAINLLSQPNEIKIQDEDSLFIPEISNQVYVYGEVSKEGALSYSESSNVDYYISNSGGLKTTADKKSIYVLYPNGRTLKYSKQKNLFQNKPNEKIIIYPGSVIFVPRTVDESISNRAAAQAYAAILGSIGITLASLSSINNN